MATYSGSIYYNTFPSSLLRINSNYGYIKNNILFPVTASQVTDIFKSTVNNINYFSASQIVDNFKTTVNNINYFSASTQENSSLRTRYTNQTTNIIVGNSGSTTTYYQRIFSSGLNDWSYYKTTGSINTNPSSNITVPQYSGSILYHEIIGKLES